MRLPSSRGSRRSGLSTGATQAIDRFLDASAFAYDYLFDDDPALVEDVVPRTRGFDWRWRSITRGLTA